MKTVWEKYKDSYKPIMDFAEGYKSFITSAKTEREQVTNSIALAEKYGYKNLDTVKEVKAGDNSTVSLNNLIDSKSYKDIRYGIKLCNKNIGFNGKFYTFPYFLTFLLKRYLKEK